MIAIFRKELSSFFASLTGYIAAIVFLATTALILWVLPGPMNIPDSGYATLDSLFAIAPWLFLFLVPAITMRSFSDEKRSGTIELLLTKPIGDSALVAGKYLSALFLVLLILIPSLTYFVSVFMLGNPPGNIDMGGTWGSFIGLFFLASAYASIGIFTSTLSDNSIVAFLLAVILSLFAFSGPASLASLPAFNGLKSTLLALSIKEHYSSMSRGVIDSRDVVYFISFALVFLTLARTKLESRKW